MITLNAILAFLLTAGGNAADISAIAAALGVASDDATLAGLLAGMVGGSAGLAPEATVAGTVYTLTAAGIAAATVAAAAPPAGVQHVVPLTPAQAASIALTDPALAANDIAALQAYFLQLEAVAGGVDNLPPFLATELAAAGGNGRSFAVAIAVLAGYAALVGGAYPDSAASATNAAGALVGLRTVLAV